MATLDNAIWINGSTGYAESGSTTLSENGNTTTVNATFTANAWDETQSGYNVSEFGAYGTTTPITATYAFSNPVENLSFDFNHVNDDGGSTYDDQWTIHAYDADGNLIDATTVIAGLSGVQDENVSPSIRTARSRSRPPAPIANDVSLSYRRSDVRARAGDLRTRPQRHLDRWLRHQ